MRLVAVRIDCNLLATRFARLVGFYRRGLTQVPHMYIECSRAAADRSSNRNTAVTRWRAERMDYGLAVEVLLAQAQRVRAFARSRGNRPRTDLPDRGVFLTRQVPTHLTESGRAGGSARF